MIKWSAKHRLMDRSPEAADPERILLMIDDLNSGGAQRQIVYLAFALKGKGFESEIFKYTKTEDFFSAEVRKGEIKVWHGAKPSGCKLTLLISLIRILMARKPLAIIAYLPGPSFLAEIASVFLPTTFLIVSERSSFEHDSSRLKAKLLRVVHHLADRVIANSHSHANWLKSNTRLDRKVGVIPNGYPLAEDYLPPARTVLPKFVAIGRVSRNKNPDTLAKALIYLADAHNLYVQVLWVGRVAEESDEIVYFNEVKDLLATRPEVDQNWEWMGEQTDVLGIVSGALALIHPSSYEGSPNVICEAFSVGRIALASDVSDNSLLLGADDARGFLFDAQDFRSLADVIMKTLTLTDEALGQKAHLTRDFLATELSIERMANSYIDLWADQDSQVAITRKTK